MIKATEKELKEQMQKRIQAYARVFDTHSPFVQDVLRDLAQFCRAHESTFHADARLHAVLEGRREVWLRIQEALNLSFEEIYDYHSIHGKIQRSDNK